MLRVVPVFVRWGVSCHHFESVETNYPLLKCFDRVFSLLKTGYKHVLPIQLVRDTKPWRPFCLYHDSIYSLAAQGEASAERYHYGLCDWSIRVWVQSRTDLRPWQKILYHDLVRRYSRVERREVSVDTNTVLRRPKLIYGVHKKRPGDFRIAANDQGIFGQRYFLESPNTLKP
jgi:hypothetical protein